MKKSAFLLMLLLGVLITSCKKDEDPEPTPDSNKEVADKLPGTWISTKVTHNGTNVTASVSGTMTFRSDKTMDFTGVESGFSISDTGIWQVKDEGKTLSLTLNSTGSYNYKINSFSDTKMTLEITFGGSTRIFEFTKQ